MKALLVHSLRSLIWLHPPACAGVMHYLPASILLGLISPYPYDLSHPDGPRSDAVDINLDTIDALLNRPPSRAISSAAVAATYGVAIDVPDSVQYLLRGVHPRSGWGE